MIGNRRFVILLILLVGTSIYLTTHADLTVPPNKPFASFPAAFSGWQMDAQTVFSSEVLDVLRPTDYLYRQYVDAAGHRVTLYVGYHSGGKESGVIHSPKHCLPGSGWFEASSQKISVSVPSQTIHAVEAVYQKGDDRELFVYWFQTGHKTLSDEYSLKAAEIWGSLFHRRRDAAFIRISVPSAGDSSVDMAVARHFIYAVYPALLEYLPQ